MAAKKRSKKAQPKKAQPKKAQPKKAQPKKAPPRKAAPKKATSKKAAPKKAGPKPLPARDSAAAQRALGDLRKKIDRLDAKLVQILNDRAELVVEVGRVKQRGDVPIYAPHREAEVLERVLSQSKGPLPGRTIEGVYKELMSGSFALEQPLRIGFLGPPGSHSHHAAVTQFGSSVAYEDLHEITGVFTEVRRGHVDYGLVPIENTTGGGIADTLMAFQEHAGSVAVYGEILISIHHALLSNVKPSEVKRIHSKPEVFSQCKTWLATQYPGAELISAASSSRAAQTALEENKKAVEIGAQPQAAAVGSKLAGQIYGLKVLFPRIEDNPDNITRFFILSAQRAERSGDDKTSIMFQTVDKPGALVEVLGVFDRAGINLSHIDKRPSGRVNWEYTFFIDAAGHRDDPGMARAILEAEKHCKDLTVLGSYPRAKRIL